MDKSASKVEMMQVIFAGFSLRSSLSMDCNIIDNGNDLIVVSTLHGRISGFKKYDVHNSRAQTHVYVVLVGKHLISYEVKERVLKNLDVVFVVKKSRDTEVLVGSKHACLSAESSY